MSRHLAAHALTAADFNTLTDLCRSREHIANAASLLLCAPPDAESGPSAAEAEGAIEAAACAERTRLRLGLALTVGLTPERFLDSLDLDILRVAVEEAENRYATRHRTLIAVLDALHADALRREYDGETCSKCDAPGGMHMTTCPVALRENDREETRAAVRDAANDVP